MAEGRGGRGRKGGEREGEREGRERAEGRGGRGRKGGEGEGGRVGADTLTKLVCCALVSSKSWCKTKMRMVYRIPCQLVNRPIPYLQA